MLMLTPESLSIYPSRLPTNCGNGYLQPFAIGNLYSSSQAEIFPSHDCSNAFGGQQVTVVHQGDTPTSGGAPQSESGQFPLSSAVSPLSPNFVAPNSDVNANPLPPGGPSAYAACTVAPDFPSLFGGGKIPEVLPDQ